MKSFTPLSGALLSVSLLGGCSHLDKPPLDESYLNDSLQQRSGYTLQNPDSKNLGALPGGINLSDGISEAEAVTTALWNNAEFHAALADLELAKADVTDADRLPNPIISIIFPSGDKLAAATLYQSIDFLWQRPARLGAAALKQNQMAEQLAQRGLLLIQETIAAHAELINRDSQVEIQQRQAALLAEIAQIYQLRLKSGDISEIGVANINIDALRAREQLLAAKAQQQIAAANLERMLGIAKNSTPLTATVPQPPSWTLPSEAELIQQALNNRTDLHAEQSAVEAAAEQLGVEKGKVFKLTAMVDYKEVAGGSSQLGPGLQLELPIFSQNSGPKARAAAQLRQAAARYQAKWNQVVFEVKQALAEYQRAAETLHYWRDEIVPQQAQILRNREQALARGNASYLDKLEAERQYLATRLSESQASADYRVALAKLGYSLGRFQLGNSQ